MKAKREYKRIMSDFIDWIAAIPKDVTASKNGFTQSFIWKSTHVRMGSLDLNYIIKTAEVDKELGGSDIVIMVNRHCGRKIDIIKL